MGKTRKRNRPFDPAEAARKLAERERYTRNTPAEWGVNREALGLSQNGEITMTDPTREKTARVERYNCFALLQKRRAISSHQHEAVKRLEEKLAERYRLEGLQGSGPASRPIPISDRSLQASQCLDAIQAETGAASYALLLALLEPQVHNGQPVNNWRAVVQRKTGEIHDAGQANRVRLACDALRMAWIAYDNGERKAA